MGKLELIECLKAHDGRAWNVAWHPKGEYLASCGEDKTICIWGKDFGKWEKKVKLTEGHSRTIREITWSPCGNYIASASFDGTIGIWDKKNGEWECNASLEGHENEVKSVAWASSGQLLASCSRDKSVWVWEIGEEDEYECAAVLNSHTQDVKKVKWHPYLDLLASVSYDNTIKIFKEEPNDHDWICTATLSSHDSTVWSLAFNKTGSKFASVSDDKTVKIWKEYKPNNEENIPTPVEESVWKNICTLSGYHNRTIYDVSWCQINDLIVTACGDDAIRVFKETDESNENEPSYELVCSKEKAHSQDVNSVTWNPAIPGLLASCSDDGSVSLWQYKQALKCNRNNWRAYNFVLFDYCIMDPQGNCLDDLISSFEATCSALQTKAELNLKEIEKDCGEEFYSSIKSLRKFDEIVADISETCSEVVNNNEILKSATIIDKSKNVINLPYNMHLDVVKCINELFTNFTPLEKKTQEDKLIDENNELRVSELIKVCEKNISDVKDIESTIIEAKEMI